MNTLYMIWQFTRLAPRSIHSSEPEKKFHLGVGKLGNFFLEPLFRYRSHSRGRGGGHYLTKVAPMDKQKILVYAN